MGKNVSLFKKLAMLTPTTNYLSINYDLNSHGYKNLLAFYRKVKAVKRAFMKYYIDAVYFQKKVNVEPFLEDEEILFKYESKMTWEIPGGIIISLIFFLAFMTGAWKRYKKTLYQLPQRDKKMEDEEDIELKSGLLTPMDVYEDLLENQVYCLFSGHGKEFVRKGYNYGIILDNKDLKDNTEKLDFLFLPHMKTFPGDVKTGALLDLAVGLTKMGKERRTKLIEDNHMGPLLNTPLGTLNAEELGRVFLALLGVRVFKHYLVCDVTLKMTVDFAKKLKEQMEDLADDHRANLLFITSDFLCSSNYTNHGHYFSKDSMFFQVLDTLRKRDPKLVDPDAPGKKSD